MTAMTDGSLGLSPAKRLLLQKLLSGEAEASVPRSIGVVRRGPAAGPPPISPEQTQVWLHASIAEDVPLYNEPVIIHRRGPLDPASLDESFNDFVRRHEIWRTCFRLVEGSVRQFVLPELRVPLPLTDLSHLPEAERESEARRLATGDLCAPFDLGRAPLFRARVLKLAPDYHRLYLALHHIIFDGVSIYQVLLPELAAGYEAHARGEAPRIAWPAIQYGDYALWRLHRLANDAMSEQMNYWRAQLSGELPILDLPCDHPRPARPSWRGAMESFTLTGELTEALRELGRSEGATLYMVLLAAFKVLLYRYTGHEDLVIGGTVDMRRRPELQGLIGYFLNSIVLRTRPSGGASFRDFLAQVKGVVLDGLAASDIPFDRLVRELNPRRAPGRHPLFDILFLVEPPTPAFPEGWDLSQTEVAAGTAKFDLYLELDERPDRIIGRCIYSTDLFEPGTIRRMIGHWIRLLHSAVADPEARLDALPMLTPGEARELLVARNDTAHEVPSATLPSWFEDQVRRTPDCIALRFDDESMSYRELDRRAEELAARLRAKAIGRECLVGLCLERTPEMIIGLLAILKSGAAYLPLDPDLPRARIDLIIRDARCSALLTRRALLPRLPDLAVPVLHLDETVATRAPDPAYPGGAEPQSLAYVLYTSGSTGQPKGVEVPEHSLVNLLQSMQREPGFGAGDTWLAVTALSFDIAALEIFLPLVSGGTLVLASSETVADPTRLTSLIQRSDPTVMQATPTLWRSLIDAGWSGHPGLKILCGGEALSRPLADALLARGGSLWNLYGPTETTIWSTLHRVQSRAGAVPIGRPIANTRVYVLDHGDTPVPVSVAGELYIAGAGLARGYRSHDAQTRERFVKRPGVPEERLYRTGDVVRWRSDGTLEFVARADAQLKLRGFRIAPEEVEAGLETHPGVGAAAVTGVTDRQGDQSLVAYIVARAGRAPEPKELRRHLGQILPAYMIPSRFVTLPKLPVTPNGKLDRKHLPIVGRIAPIGELEALHDDDERRLALVWRDVLGVPQVHPDDNFFELGGHSLLAAKLLRRIEAAFGVRLPMAAVLQAPTLAGMAQLISVPAVRPPPRSTEPTAGLIWVNGGPVFRHLKKSLEPDVPLIAVAVTPDDFLRLGEAPSLTAIAGLVVDAIRSVHPDGPYRLGGWCTDGILAFEVATQLMRQGAAVELLVLLHAVNPVQFRRLGRSSLQLSKFKYHWKKLRHLHGSARWAYAAARVRGAAEPAAPWLRETGILHNAALRYEPPPYPGAVLLLQPAERPDILNYGPGWARLIAGDFSIHECPGDHCSMLEPPYVDVMASRIRERIEASRKLTRAVGAAE